MFARRLKSILILSAAALFLGLIPFGVFDITALSQSAPSVDFKTQILPILESSCLSCHGAKKAMGQLRLDLKSAAFKGGISGAIIVPGKSRESRLLARVQGTGGEVRMPLGGSLTDGQITLIRRWIDQGALWPDDPAAVETAHPTHWAYQKPSGVSAPAVVGKGRVRNPIDNFVIARLDKEGLTMSPEADGGKLLRRVYLDLIGLPPSPAEVDAYLSDVSPDAYERAVDRLLRSERFGERWARHWLDLARYADSNGFEKDNPRVMWKYRDWVIDAFNRNLPFDQFTIEQIAGDMLPNATTAQRIATGFHRNTMLNQEGGIDPEEARFETLLDRVNTTATVWLGSTLGCAQCHNHKYDPFSQKDYYRFLAFFEGAEYKIEGQGFERFIREPELMLSTPEQEKKRLEISAEINTLTEFLKTQTPALDAAQTTWEATEIGYESLWTAPSVASTKSDAGAVLTVQKDLSILAAGPNSETEAYTIVLRPGVRTITGLKLEAIIDERLPKSGPGRDPYGNFLLTGIDVSATGSDPEVAAGSRVRPLSLRDGGVDDSAVRFDIKRLTTPGARSAAVDAPAGWYVNATRDSVRFNRQAVFVLNEPFRSSAGSELTVKLRFEGGSLGQGLGRFRLSVSDTADPLAIVQLPARFRPVLHTAVTSRVKKDRDDLAAQFRSVTPLLKSERDRLRALNVQLTGLGIIPALVMQEREARTRPETFLRERGSFLAKGERLTAAVPDCLPPITGAEQVNRLSLARWLVSQENPLTARVTVNRFWEQLFGRGLVETSEDFGAQGAPPTHPELLDWLATEFVRQRWDVKGLLRTIVTSSTYRQSSTVTAAMRERDPDNRLLARGPRFRIEAEMVRDVALSVSGLLSAKIGGPSVYPWQPEGIWRNPYSGAKWVVSSGEDRYRRSLYTFARRTSPYPSMLAFDATSRETCTVRRVRTNTPLQALTALNDEAFFELARALARRIATEGGSDISTRLDYGIRLCMSRRASPMEIQRLSQLFDSQRQNYTAHPEEAQKVLKGVSAGPAVDQGELAALTIVANVLLNLDETLNKE